MSISFDCTNCGSRLSIAEYSPGARVKCPTCQNVMPLPETLPDSEPDVDIQPRAASQAATAPDEFSRLNPYASPAASEPFAAPPTEPSDGRTGPAWERDGPSAASFVATIKQVLGQTNTTFRRMRRTGGFGAPLLFGVLSGAVGVAVSLIYDTAIELIGGAPLADVLIGAAIGLGMVLVIYPVVLFLYAGVYHLMLLILGGANQGFEATFRVVCYVTGACSILLIIPIAGQLVNTVCQIVFTIMGLARTHEISGGKATAAVLLPLVVCCAAAVGLAVLIAGTLGPEFRDLF